MYERGVLLHYWQCCEPPAAGSSTSKHFAPAMPLPSSRLKDFAVSPPVRTTPWRHHDSSARMQRVYIAAGGRAQGPGRLATASDSIAWPAWLPAAPAHCVDVIAYNIYERGVLLHYWQCCEPPAAGSSTSKHFVPAMLPQQQVEGFCCVTPCQYNAMAAS